MILSGFKKTKEEMIAYIVELEKENQLLKGAKPNVSFTDLLQNRNDICFLSPYYYEHEGGWKLSPAQYNLNYLRSLAVCAVDIVSEEQVVRQKIANMKAQDLLLVAECADELAQVMTKYKKKYLLSIEREDIIKAFNV